MGSFCKLCVSSLPTDKKYHTHSDPGSMMAMVDLCCLFVHKKTAHGIHAEFSGVSAGTVLCCGKCNSFKRAPKFHSHIFTILN
jgi:hypothetical protein